LEESVLKFYKKLIQFPPPVSRIKDHRISQIEDLVYDGFKIDPSKKGGQLNLSLTPDFAICDVCTIEISDPENRRYGYPFTTCVNCGPRWAITKTFPFERNHTSIDEFKMCEACLNEYTDPADRRFHSQTNTCTSCGIDLFLYNQSGEKIVVPKATIFKKIASLLLENHIIAIKNTSGYLLCCNAENEEVVQQLRDKKNRPNKPFAVLYPSLDHLKDELQVNALHEKSLASAERPINIITLKGYKGNIALHKVAPGLNQLGVMLPYSGILQLLANELDIPIVATSGNIHGSPIISENEDALEKLKKVAEYFLQHSLKITHPQDDSVVKFSTQQNKEVLFRRSRGYAPNYFNATLNSGEKIMALGAHLKSSIAYNPNEFLYISQYLGNLDNFDVYHRFTATTTKFISLFEQNPEVVLCDKHPAYQSTQFGMELAQELGVKLFQIQHHKAHFASVLGEHELFDGDDPVLGIVWDGTGYGDDGHIWGGEFFDFRSKKMERISHFESFDWLAGDKMAKEPRLSLFSLAGPQMQSTVSKKFSEEEWTIYQALQKHNKLKTSSVGRLFDAVASLLNICDINTYEGEAAILLENLVTNYSLKNCKSYFNGIEDGISSKEIIYNIYLDHELGESIEQILINFLYTLALSIMEMAKSRNYRHIALSGGVFQNTTLVDMLIELAPKEIKLYFHKELSPNDENISFGQIMYYLHIKN
jgi:hydrogenase maturation protein HypF